MKERFFTTLVSILFSAAVFSEPIKIAKISNTPDHILGGKLLAEVYRRAGISLEFVVIQSKRALVESSTGGVDGELQRIFEVDKAYPTLVKVPTPFTYFEPAVFSATQDFQVFDWSSLKGRGVIGLVRGMKYSENALDGVNDIYTVADSGQLMKMLAAGRIELAVTGKFNGLYQVKSFKLESIQQLAPSLGRRQLYHYLHIKHKALVPKLDTVIQSMTDSGELESLREKYIEEIMAQSDRRIPKTDNERQ